jgi:hypothetical protein
MTISTLKAQVGIGTYNPDASAALEISSSSKGFLAPRIALTSATDVTTIATPATGLMVYNTATAGSVPNAVVPGYYYYSGTKWERLITATSDATINFNTADPNSGSPTFTPNTPASIGYIYQSTTNASQWIYDGTTYVTYTAPSSTAWNLVNTTNDAGNNKTNDIWRSGGVIAGGTSTSKVFGNLTSYGGTNFSGGVPYGTASIGLISNTTAGWTGSGFLFGNSTSGSNAFTATINNDKVYQAWIAPNNTYNLTSMGNATGWMFGANINAGLSPTYALEARGVFASTSNAYLATLSGKVGVGTTSPYSTLSNTANNILGSDAIGTSSTGITWLNNNIGYSATVFNTGTSSNFNGLAIKIAGNTSSNRALDISQGTTAGSAGTPLFNVLANGNVGIGTNSPTTNLDVVGGFNLRNTTGAAGSNYGIEFNTNSTAPRIDWVFNGGYIGQFTSDANDFQLRNSKQATGGFRFFTNPTGTAIERMAILNNGNIGIGTTTPYSQLANTASTIQGSIISSVNGGFNWVSPGTGFAHSVYASNNIGGGAQVKVAGNTSNVYAFEVSQASTQTGITTPLFNVIGNGNVGVGTNSPAAQLHTTGSIRFAGAGTPGVGKILTSDASGNATWQSTAIATKTADYTLTANDFGSVLVFNSASTVVLTIPSSLSAGFYCQVIQQGTGQVNVVGASGVSVTSALGSNTRTTGSSIGILLSTGTSAFLSGDTSF